MRLRVSIILIISIVSTAPLFAAGQTHIIWPAGSILSDVQLEMFGGADSFFLSEEISDDTFSRIEGVSYARGCSVPRSRLRLLHLLHRNFRGHIQVGEMICNKSVADDLLRIFRELYDVGYPIEKIYLIDEYGADDNLSMADNNTSCFNFRRKPGMKELSMHARGLAVDINPLYNPYVRGERIEPASGAVYADRTRKCPYYIRRGDACHAAFTSRGWSWGGSWNSMKDYQHFEKKQ